MVIPESDDQKGHRLRRGSQGARRFDFVWVGYKNRRRRTPILRCQAWRVLATRYDKRTMIYRADIRDPAVIAWTKALSRDDAARREIELLEHAVRPSARESRLASSRAADQTHLTLDERKG